MMLTDWSRDGNLHGHHWRWHNGVVDIWHEAGVHTASKFDARLIESRLSDSVVLRVENEDDRITKRSGYRFWNKDETCGSSNDDLASISEEHVARSKIDVPYV